MVNGPDAAKVCEGLTCVDPELWSPKSHVYDSAELSATVDWFSKLPTPFGIQMESGSLKLATGKG
jgi:hypothetical protein